MKSIVMFCVIILGAGQQAAAAVKDCDELKSEIAAKLVNAGVPSFVLEIVDKDRIGSGRIIGSCENSTKRIVRRVPATASASGNGRADRPSRPSASLTKSIEDCEKLKSEIAAKLTVAGISPAVLTIVDQKWGGAGRIVGSCENGTKRIVRIPSAAPVSGTKQADSPSRPSVTFAYAIKDCEELKSEIAAKLIAAGVSSFVLEIVTKDRTGSGKIIGSCENGTKRIIRRKDP